MARPVTMEPLEARVVALERLVADLKTRLDRMDVNGLDVLRSQSLYLEPGGTNGDSTQAARADHTH